MFTLALRGVRMNAGRYIATLVAIMTGVAFFIVGAVKGRFVRQNGFVSGLETLAVGAVAAAMAYACGVLLGGLIEG